MINNFCHDISFSSTCCKTDVMEHCSHEQRANMDTSEDLSSLYFYLHLPIVYDLRVLIPFTSFEIEFVTDVNMATSQITPNVWGILGLSR